MSLLSPNRLKARIAPHLHWRVPFEAGIYANSPRWSNKGLQLDKPLAQIMLTISMSDLDPVPVHMRTWGGLVSDPYLSDQSS